ncbi:MAG: transcription termination factor NusA [Dehalococcoidia bacterium]|nr:transcription termination factor NusA [Dehalococcoidia bacterium]
MKSEFMIAITQLAAEKNLPQEVILDAMEAALVSAYKKDSDLQGNIVVRIDRETGEHRVFHEQTVVAEVEDPKTQISLPDARKIKPDATIEDVISNEVHPSHAGRIAAQTAKQVVLQRLREAEREMVFEEFSNREGDVVSGVIQRIDAKAIVVDLGKTEAILPPPEQVRTEHYRPGQRQKFYLLEVHRSLKGPQLILSRTHKNLLRRLFELEVPEIHKGVVEIRSIAREAGYRSKVAVTARQEGVDPVGSCVGLRGIRIQNIVNELNGERIDVVQWDQDAARFVANALSPAQVLNVTVSEETNTASVVVPDRQLSLAIGREGQNARLAAKLTGWRIDIKPESAMQEVLAAAPAAAKPAAAAPAAPVAPPGEREAQPWMEAIEGEGAEAAPAVAEPVAEALEAPAMAESTVEAAAGGIRFAEEVLPPPTDSGDGKKRKKAKKVERKPEETEAKAKKTKRTRRPVIVEEDDEGDDDDFEEFKA